MTTTDKTINSYNSYAKEYTDHLTSDLNFWNNYLESPAMKEILSNIVKGKSVLDLGCGSGISSKKLKDWGGKVTGIDISKKMIDLAKESVKEIEFIVGDITATGFQNEQFDIVSSSLVLHYIRDIELVFKEVNRITKSLGKFVFSMHHPFFDIRKSILIDGKKEYILKPYFNREKFEWSMVDKGMVLDSYHHTFSDITNNLINSGFLLDRVIETQPIPEGKKVDPKDYEKTMQYPTFIVFESTKK